MSVKAKVGDVMRLIIKPKKRDIWYVMEHSKCGKDCILRCWEFARW